MKNIFLRKKNPVLKSHFYQTITFLDSINTISNSEKITKIVKNILKRKPFSLDLQVRVDHSDDPYYLPQHQS